jgi:hypothetical protein
MTTQTRGKSTPKDKFYRRYAAAYVLGIPAEEVPEYSWKALLPRIYGEEGVEPDPVVLEKFRTTKSMLKGLSGATVIEMVTEAQIASEVVEPAVIEDVKPKAKAPARKPATKAKSKSLGARVKKTTTSDADAINQLYGNKS